MFKSRNEKISRCLDSMKIACANNKCADQPAHPRTLISAFVPCLDSMITKSYCKLMDDSMDGPKNLNIY